MNRSFWTAGTSSGFVTNAPGNKWTQENTVETLFDRLEAHGRTWKVYVWHPHGSHSQGGSTCLA
jgi:phospholipase C